VLHCTVAHVCVALYSSSQCVALCSSSRMLHCAVAHGVLHCTVATCVLHSTVAHVVLHCAVAHVCVALYSSSQSAVGSQCIDCPCCVGSLSEGKVLLL
jgi:hypothetical protein